MTKKEFYAIIEEVLEFDEGTITGEESLEELDSWDSLAVVSFIALIDETLGITMSAEKILESQTVNDLAAILGNEITN